jgi:hypothetical protein
VQLTRKNRWIQGAVNPRKRGSLHRQLGVPKGEKIPKDLLNAVKAAEPGRVVRAGGKRVRVTRLMKKRANLAVTLRKVRR